MRRGALLRNDKARLTFVQSCFTLLGMKNGDREMALDTIQAMRATMQKIEAKLAQIEKAPDYRTTAGLTDSFRHLATSAGVVGAMTEEEIHALGFEY